MFLYCFYQRDVFLYIFISNCPYWQFLYYWMVGFLIDLWHYISYWKDIFNIGFSHWKNSTNFWWWFLWYIYLYLLINNQRIICKTYYNYQRNRKNVYAIHFQHYTFFGAKRIATNICNLELICLFIYQISIKDESTYQSISKKW